MNISNQNLFLFFRYNVCDICTSFNLNSVHHDSDTDQLQAFNNNIVSSMTYVIKIAGVTADETFNTTDELIAKHKHHNIRLHYLLNPWSSMPNLTNNNNDHVESYDRKITNFIHDVGNSLKKARTLKLIDPYIVLDEYDNKMNQTFSKIKKNIHSALCNDIDLSGAMEQIINLLDIIREYINGEKFHAKLVENIYDKILNLLKIFGLKYKDVFYCEKNLDDDK
jgi:cysteinyl-tRNA synthetase